MGHISVGHKFVGYISYGYDSDFTGVELQTNKPKIQSNLRALRFQN